MDSRPLHKLPIDESYAFDPEQYVKVQKPPTAEHHKSPAYVPRWKS